MSIDDRPTPDRGGDEPWPVSWEANRRAHILRWSQATPLQRLEWLEEMMRLAHDRGALPRRGGPAARPRSGS